VQGILRHGINAVPPPLLKEAFSLSNVVLKKQDIDFFYSQKALQKGELDRLRAEI
jgi:hypothetical protein